ncbi:hypothetical protein SAMN02910265_01703 [Ruminococcus flavefaciens]|uniref:Uncharacterized protein n=1 Tax=Ruminococcus flavefaciens TaxID=1265 RepID=A0A1H6JNP9_RUMFL|nr:hypothetical protein [Ruminococcus flavefaciens]SEH60912.1 hypothetical protein SAMN02910265_01703 [Ruminococcus flavefaciens]
MAVYDLNKPRRGNEKLYRGVYRTPAADLPPQKCEESYGEECSKQKVKSEKEPKALGGLVDEFFEGGVDSDKLLIAALLYMLIKEGADIKLIIALGYILM